MMKRIAIVLFAALPLFGQSSPQDLIPNSVKYSDTGAKPVKGRSGSASIEARALLGMDGATTIEVTTGSFESSVAGPGSIDRLQIKQDFTSENAITANVNTSGSFVSVPVTGLVWREPVQLQAHVSGVDPNRTDVVTVTETVKRRPNLMVEPRVAPHAVVGLPYSANVVIWERNGELGARATCVMRDNGVEVDRAEGIWIDAGSRVVCHMLHTFTSAGVHNVEFALIDQSPADWDERNNVARIALPVYATAEQMTRWSAYTQEETRQMRFSSSSSSPTEYSGGNDDQTDISQFTSFNAVIEGAFDFMNLRASFFERTDGGTMIYEDAAPQFFPPWPEPNGCKFSDRRSAYTTICSNNGLTSIQYFRGSGKAIYISEGWQYWLWDGEWQGFHYVMNMSYQQNWMNSYGDTIALEFRVSDGNKLWEAAPVIPLNVDTQESASSGCYGSVPTCWSRSEKTVVKSGSASHPQ